MKSLIRSLDTTRASATQDADLASDPRLVAEAAKIQSVRRLGSAALAMQVVLLVALIVTTIVEIEDLHFWTTGSTIEFADVTILPASIDFLKPTTVDVADGHVSQIGPYDPASARQAKNLRSFEARGKFLVVVDASQAGWLGQVQAGGAKQIEIGTGGDFVVVDVDPRMQSVSRTQIAAAVINGQYLSREDVLAKFK